MALSVAIELPVALLLARFRRPDLDWTRVALVGVGATLVTHPFAWSANQTLTLSPWVRLGVIEAAVALAEGVMYAAVAGLGWRRGLLIGLLANAASFGIGLVLWALG